MVAILLVKPEQGSNNQRHRPKLQASFSSLTVPCDRLSYEISLGEQTMRAFSFSVLAFSMIAGCQNNRAAAPVSDPEYERQIEQYQEQLDKGDEQIERLDRMYDKSEEQAERMDILLDRWEKQADRYDKILDKWENQPAPNQ
jgi:hypothetical protein